MVSPAFWKPQESGVKVVNLMFMDIWNNINIHAEKYMSSGRWKVIVSGSFMV